MRTTSSRAVLIAGVLLASGALVLLGLDGLGGNGAGDAHDVRLVSGPVPRSVPTSVPPHGAALPVPRPDVVVLAPLDVDSRDSVVVEFTWPPDASPVEPVHVFTVTRESAPGIESHEVSWAATPARFVIDAFDAWELSLAGRTIASGAPTGASLDIDLALCPTLLGIVEQRGGLGLGGVEVTMAFLVEGLERTVRTSTREDGSFALAAFPGDVESTLTASRPGWTEARRSGVIADTRDRLEPLELILERAEALVGRVVDPEGRPVADLTVQLLPSRGTNHQRTTDAEGGFVFESIAGWPVYLAAKNKQGYAEFRQDEPPAFPLRLAFVPWAEIAGQVLWDDGEPAAAIRVRLVPTMTTGSEAVAYKLTRNVYTAEDGRFSGPTIHGSSTLVTVSGPHSRTHVFAPGEFADIELTRPRTWRVFLRPETGAIDGATIRLIGETWSFIFTPSVLDNGQLLVETRIPFDEHIKLVLRLPEQLPTTAYEGVAGEVHDALIDVRSKALRQVDMIVRERGGAFVDGALVQIQWPANWDHHVAYEFDRRTPFSPRPSVSRYTRTDAEGDATLHVPADSDLHVVVTAAGYRPLHRDVTLGEEGVLPLFLSRVPSP